MGLKRKFISNLSYAFIAQIISLLISVVVNLILPKFIGIEQYSYWQLFIFYSQYIPFLHLGLNDGVYLRYGGMTYSSLDKRSVKSQLILGIAYQAVFSIVLCTISAFAVKDSYRLLIIILACIYFLVYTVQNYMGYIFQAINETAIYSKTIIINRIFFVSAILLWLILNRFYCWYFICAYIIAQIIALCYLISKGLKILEAQMLSLKETLSQLKISISVGSKLMIANIASMLILGCSRQIIDMRWGLLTFGKISFSITLTNFVLTFIQQVGMVMFPMLRRLEFEQQKKIYELCRTVMFILLPIMFILYFPGRVLLQFWLPDYAESLKYLALLLPICFFDTKMQMLCNTYLKVQRKENILFVVNIVAMLMSFLISLVGAYIFNNLNVVVSGMTISIMVRSVVSEIYLSKSMNIKIYKSIFQEILLVFVFMIVAWYLPIKMATIIIIMVYAVLIAINVKKINKLKQLIK